MIVLVLLMMIFSVVNSINVSLVHAQGTSDKYLDLYNPLLNGATCDDVTLNAAIASSDSSGKTIYITGVDRTTQAPCTWTLANNVTVPSTRRLLITSPIVVNTGVVLTINGGFQSLIGDNWYSGNGRVILSSAPWRNFTRYVNVGDYGQLGTSDDSGVIQAACDVIGARDTGISQPTATVLFFPSTQINIATAITCNVPDGTVWFAYGTDFRATTDVVMVDLNPDASTTDASGTIVASVRVLGGWYTNSAATATQSVAFKIHHGRNVVFRDWRISGFYHGIEYGGKDTWRFEDGHCFNNKVCVYKDDFDNSGEQTIDLAFRDVHFSAGASQPRNPDAGAWFTGKYINVSIYGGSCNAGVDGSGVACMVFENVSQGTSQNPRHITIQDVHFEGSDGKHVWFKDTAGAGQGYTNVHILHCTFAGIGATGIVLERVDSIVIEKSYFVQLSASGGIPIDASDANNSMITLAGTNIYSTSKPLVNVGALHCSSYSGISETITATDTIVLPTTCPDNIFITGATQINTFSVGYSGQVIFLQVGIGVNFGSSGNILTNGPFTANATPAFIAFLASTTQWRELWRSYAKNDLLVTVADSGDGNPATNTVETLARYVLVTCNDTDGCLETISEAVAYADQEITFINQNANPLIFKFISAQQRTPGLLVDDKLIIGDAGVVTFLYNAISGASQWTVKSSSSQRGSFTITGNGFTANPTGVVQWTLNNGVVNLNVPVLSGTSNATTFTLTGLPVYLQSHRDHNIVVKIVDNGSSILGVAAIAADSSTVTITAYPAGALTAFTASGTKTLNAVTLNYVVN